MSIRILLVDDHIIMRQGLRSLLEREPDMEVVGEAADGQTGLRLARECVPNVVVIDVVMASQKGMEAPRQIIAAVPSSRIIGLSMYDDGRFVKGMLQAGASGYISKDSAFEEMVRGIRAVAANKMYLDPSIVPTVVRDYLRHVDKAVPQNLSSLTTREREVFQLLARGKGTRQLASSLSVSHKTIETYRRNIMVKLNINNVVELVKYAIREGIVSMDE